MSETIRAVDANGTEWFIPPCVKELRVADDIQRTTRNADFRKRTSTDFQLVSYGQGYDGGMLVTCVGDGECEGGTLNVDRHDLLQDKMPETTVAMRGICTARTMFYSQNNFIRSHEATD